MANIIGSPFFVRIFLAWVMMPPAVTQSPSLWSGSEASGASTAARSASRTSLSGCAEMKSPMASFSMASSSACSNSSGGIGGCCGAMKGDGGARVAAAAEVAEVEDAPLADLGVELRLLARGLRLLEHAEHALARGAGGAEGAALDERLDRALVDRARVDAGAEVPDRPELPTLLARRLDRLDGREAHALDRVEPEADVAVDDHELVV